MGIFKIKFPPVTGGAHVNIPSRNLSLAPTTHRSVWAIGGGKGGIGKTLLTSNMAVYLSWLNKKVVVVDMDLGGANLHTSLGVDPPQVTLSDLITGKTENVQELIQPTPIRNVYLISGAQDPLGIANMRHMQKMRLIRKFREIAADFVLIDLGAGTSTNTLDFFLLADRKIVVVTPEPTSIENAYRFIKAAFFRMLRSTTHATHAQQLIEQIIHQKSSTEIHSPRELLSEVRRLSPSDGEALQSRMEKFHIDLIVNQIRVQTEANIGRSVTMVCEKYFGMRVDYAGALPYDNAVWQSIRHKIPFLMEAPNSTVVTSLEAILRNLLRPIS